MGYIEEAKQQWAETEQSVGGAGWNIQRFIDKLEEDPEAEFCYPFEKTRNGDDYEYRKSPELKNLRQQYLLQSREFSHWQREAAGRQAPRDAVLALKKATSYNSYELTNYYLVFMAKTVFKAGTLGMFWPANRYPGVDFMSCPYGDQETLNDSMFFAIEPTRNQHIWAVLKTRDELFGKP